MSLVSGSRLPDDSHINKIQQSTSQEARVGLKGKMKGNRIVTILSSAKSKIGKLFKKAHAEPIIMSSDEFKKASEEFLNPENKA